MTWFWVITPQCDIQLKRVMYDRKYDRKISISEKAIKHDTD